MTCTPRTQRAPGFTLLEMIIAVMISSLVIAGGVALLTSQQRVFQSSSGVRALQVTAGVALGDIGAALRRAGLGVDPALAIDFGRTAVVQAQAPQVSGATPTASGYLCNNPVQCRDRVDGPDELVFYARDPTFGHKLVSVNGPDSITIDGPLPVPLRQGQILQVMCTRGKMYWVYVTVAANVPADPGGAVIPLSGGASLDFPFQNQVLADPTVLGGACFGDGTGWVAKVDRFRYFVQNYDPTGRAVNPMDEGARPFLMLDQGLTDDAGAPALTAVAQDVEDIQFAYLFPRQGEPLVGGTEGTAIQAGPGPDGIDLGAASAGYGTPQGDPARSTWHPSNIRAVRIIVVVRTPTQDDRIPDAKVPAAGNRAEIDGPPGYQRLRFETTVSVPNLDARAPYFPVRSEIGGADQFNVGGS